MFQKYIKSYWYYGPSRIIHEVSQGLMRLPEDSTIQADIKAALVKLHVRFRCQLVAIAIVGGRASSDCAAMRVPGQDMFSRGIDARRSPAIDIAGKKAQQKQVHLDLHRFWFGADKKSTQLKFGHVYIYFVPSFSANHAHQGRAFHVPHAAVVNAHSHVPPRFPFMIQTLGVMDGIKSTNRAGS